MTIHIPDYQTAPASPRTCEARAQDRLTEAAAELQRCAGYLKRTSPDHAAAAEAALQTVRHSLAALLTYHGQAVAESISLAELGRRAEDLASPLRSCLGRALPLTTLVTSVKDAPRLSVEQREGAETSYYTGRNVLSVVITAIPERLTGDTILLLNRAQAVRLGRVAPAGDEREYRIEPKPSPDTPAHSPSLVAA